MIFRILFGVLMLFSFCVLGCTPILPEEEEIEYYDVVVDYNVNGDFIAYEVENGNMQTSLEAYEQDLPRLQRVAENQGKQLRIVTGENISNEMNGNYGSQNLDSDERYNAQNLEIRVGVYVITADCRGGGYVSGCISKTLPHCNLRLRRTPKSHLGGALLMDLHIAAWRDRDGRLCGGVYDSGNWNLINSCPCLPNGEDVEEMYENIRNDVFNSFLAVGVSVGTAALLSRVVTPILIGGVVIAPVP
jgi:hypothetical protein